MSFCFLYNVVSENHSVQNSPWGGEGGLLPAQGLLTHYENIEKCINALNKCFGANATILFCVLNKVYECYSIRHANDFGNVNHFS